MIEEVRSRPEWLVQDKYVEADQDILDVDVDVPGTVYDVYKLVVQFVPSEPTALYAVIKRYAGRDLATPRRHLFNSGEVLAPENPYTFEMLVRGDSKINFRVTNAQVVKYLEVFLARARGPIASPPQGTTGRGMTMSHVIPQDSKFTLVIPKGTPPNVEFALEIEPTETYILDLAYVGLTPAAETLSNVVIEGTDHKQSKLRAEDIDGDAVTSEQLFDKSNYVVLEGYKLVLWAKTKTTTSDDRALSLRLAGREVR